MECPAYQLDFYEMVEKLFRVQFLDYCQSNPGKFISVPVTHSKGNTVKVHTKTFIPPKLGAPVVLYMQGKEDGCMFCGLASALAYFGDHRKAGTICELRKKAKFDPSDWNLIMDSMTKNGPRQYGIEKWDASMPYCTNDKYTWHNCILFVVLKGKDVSKNHSISIYNNML